MRMPRSVLQSNWYYDEGFDERAFRWPRIKCYLNLEKAGVDQIPTGSNYVTDVNMAGTVAFAKAKLSAEHLKGFQVSIWRSTLPEHEQRHFDAIDQLAETGI